jgi:SNF2 family DNA or RNA helicase
MTSVLEGLVKEADLKPDVKLQPHQERVLKRLREHPANMLLFHALGSGKTLTGLAASEQTGEPFTAVVPASLRNNMRGEYEKFLDPQSQQNADVMSYSGLARGKPVRNPGVLLFDEAARLRNPATLEAQRAMELASRARQTTLLTGTPITNDPSDLAVPISMLTGRQITPKEFTDRYVGQRKVGPGFFGWLRGVPPATEPEIKRPEELKALLSGHVDYYAPQQPTVPTTQEDIPVEMSTDQSRLYHAMWGQLPWLLRWKLQHDYPLSNDDLKRTTSFLVGPRQVGLSTYTFQGENKDPLKAFQTSTKLQEAHKRLAEKLKDPRTKALVFSNFIDAGLTPYAAGLAANNIPHAMFHGGLSDNERQKLKDDYNSGKIRVALLGPSGTEGLSFKGTQLVQLLDPYWNSARGSQSKGRALRYDSHWDLPEDLKNVTVQRYTSKLPLGLMAKLKQRVGFNQETQRRATDDYLENMAARKDRLNRPFIDLLKDVGSEKVGHAHSAAGCPLGLLCCLILMYLMAIAVMDELS